MTFLCVVITIRHILRMIGGRKLLKINKLKFAYKLTPAA